MSDSDIKLERINDHLYHETGESGKIKWEKKPELLNIRVTDVKVQLCLSINKPSETSINKLVPSITAENNVNKKLEKLLPDKGDIEHIDSFGWHISETGQFTNSKIGLIRKDGKVIKWHSGDFNSAEISIKPVLETDKDKGTGWLFYMDDEIAKIERRSNSYLALELFISEKTSEKLCYEILSKSLTELNIRVDVDVFMSEAERMLRPPNIINHYFLDEQNSKFNVRILEIWASRPTKKTSSSDNKD